MNIFRFQKLVILNKVKEFLPFIIKKWLRSTAAMRRSLGRFLAIGSNNSKKRTD